MTQKLKLLSDQFHALEERIYQSSRVQPLVHLSAPGGCRIIGFTNPFSFRILSQKPDLVAQVDDWYVDGGLLCRTVSWGRNGRIPRYSFDFSSIAHGVFDHALQKGIPVALLGGTEEEITAARAYLQNCYPDVNIVWSRNGYFRDSCADGGRDAVLAELATFDVGVVIIGMGSPLQEEAAVELKNRIQANSDKEVIIFTCGGFLTQTGTSGDYYPEIIKRTGLRWVYRAARERHVRNRLIKDYPRFLIQFVASRLYRLNRNRN